MRYSILVMDSFTQYLNGIASFPNNHPFIFGLLILWTLAWKGLALWKAARLSHRIWFIIILIANTVGILEIIYLYFVAKKYSVVTEVEGGEKDSQK